MGNSQSSSLGESPLPLEQLTVEDIQGFVHGLGIKYERYTNAIEENAVDGELLASMESEVEMRETLECLEVTNFLHQKKLMNEWKKIKNLSLFSEQENGDSRRRGSDSMSVGSHRTSSSRRSLPPLVGGGGKGALNRSETTYTSRTITSEITMDTSLIKVRRLSGDSGSDEPAARFSPNSSQSSSLEEKKVSEEAPDQQEQEGEASSTNQPLETINNVHYPDHPIPMVVTTQQLEAVRSFQLPRDAPLDMPELEPFHQVSSQVFTGVGPGSLYTGVNILEDNGAAGVNGLASTIQGDAGAGSMKRARMHFDDPGMYEICRPFVLGQTTEFRIEDVPLEVCQGGFNAGASTYYGQVIRFRSLRVGTICAIVEDSQNTKTPQEIQSLLQFLAKETEQQLEQRHAMIHRNKNIQQDIQDLKHHHAVTGAAASKKAIEEAKIREANGDRIVVPPFGPVRAVTMSQIANRQTLFPYPNETPRETGNPTLPNFERRSSHLSYWRDQHAHTATPTTTGRSTQSNPHLPPNYYQPLLELNNGTTTINGARTNVRISAPVDLTPVGSKDMERVALIQSLRLLELDPLCKEAENIQSVINLTATVLQADFVAVMLMDQIHANCFFPTYGTTKLQSFASQQELVKLHPTTGQPFWTTLPRSLALCNYSIMTPAPEHQSFVVHDMSKDQSLAGYWKQIAGVGFYSGSPIVLRGMIVGVLCCFKQDEDLQFGRAQEVQQEQLASFIAQQYESWSLNQEMKRLEEERSRLSVGTTGGMDAAPQVMGTVVPAAGVAASTTVVPPEDYAALVVTDVEGVDTLWETNCIAMKDAISLHNEILRSKIADHGGCEVLMRPTSTSSQSPQNSQEEERTGKFSIAFADVVDAVKFCLATQEELHNAPWRGDVLDLAGASEDTSRGLRGLRVRMSVHCGDIESTMDPATRGIVYGGESVHIAASLHQMGYGGQILVTGDVWNVASQFVESTLGSPQVVNQGSHVLKTESDQLHDGITIKNVLQLVPASLAFDYKQGSLSVPAGGSRSAVSGRVFPPIKTSKSVGPAFSDAPCGEGNTVSIVAVNTFDIEKSTELEDPGLVLAALARRIGSSVAEHDGYQCNDFTFAFGNVTAAVRFGLSVQELLAKEDVCQVSLKGKVKIGVHEGVFESMWPHPVTGKAEYFGKVVNCSTLVAADAAAGCVYLGKEADELDGIFMQPISNGFMLDYMGRCVLRGVDVEFSLFKCHPCESWYDKVLDNRRTWKGY